MSTQPTLDTSSIDNVLAEKTFAVRYPRVGDSKVGKAVKHVKRHKKAYAVGTVFVAGGYVGYKLGVKSQLKTIVSLRSGIEGAKVEGVDSYIDSIYMSGLIPVVMDDKKYQLYMGTLVNAGESTTEQAKEAFDMVDDVRDWLGYNPAA